MSITVRSKVWLQLGKDCAFGDGRMKLLFLIDELGSLSGAAKALGMSYRHAWGSVRKIEERSGIKFIRAHAGGLGAGGASLTDEGRDFLKRYQRFRGEVEREVERCFRVAFPQKKGKIRGESG
ncbi:MAG: winged helix-turn-helix domain-containing protein [Nitrospinota bacterium]